MPLDLNKLKETRERAERKQFRKEDYQMMQALVISYSELLEAVKDENTSLDDLRKQFLSSEETDPVDDAATTSVSQDANDPIEPSQEADPETGEETPSKARPPLRRGI